MYIVEAGCRPRSQPQNPFVEMWPQPFHCVLTWFLTWAKVQISFLRLTIPTRFEGALILSQLYCHFTHLVPFLFPFVQFSDSPRLRLRGDQTLEQIKPAEEMWPVGSVGLCFWDQQTQAANFHWKNWTKRCQRSHDWRSATNYDLCHLTSFEKVSYRYTAKQGPSKSESNYTLACKNCEIDCGHQHLFRHHIPGGQSITPIYSETNGVLKRVWPKIRPTTAEPTNTKTWATWWILWSQSIWAHEISSKLLHRLSWHTKVSKATWNPPALAGAQSVVKWPAGAICKK